MNNIYDVVFNFNKYYYEVYEWRNSDNIESIRKLPFFRVNDKTYLCLKNMDVKISSDSLDRIRNSISYFDNKNSDIKCIVTNGKSCMGIIVNKKGCVVGRSSMLYDEEDEVIEEARDVIISKIEFDSIKPINYFGSRIENEKRSYLLEYLDRVNDKDLLKYIYYDYYLRECSDVDIIKKSMIDEIKCCDYDKLFKLYDLVIMLGNIKSTS